MAHDQDPDGRLAAYADGELDDAATAEVEALLAHDPEARALVALHRETSGLLRAAYPESRFAGATLPPSRAASRPAAPPPRRLRPGWAVAAALLLGLVGYGAGTLFPLPLQSEQSRMLAEIAEYHAVYARETVHLVEADASQAEHIRAWIGNRVQRQIVIPDLAAAGLTFAGVRLVAIEGQPAAAFMYTRKDGLPIAVCMIREAGAAAGTQVEQHEGMSLATWRDGTHLFVIVGDAPATTVRALAEQVQRQI